jgi:tol-pal system protein YbgF
MNTRAVTRLCLWALVIAAPAAASAQNREHQQLFADLRMLQEQTQQLRLSVAALAESLTAITKRVDDQGGTTRKLFADQGLVISALADSARVLREKLDATNVSLSKDSHELETMRQELTAQRTLLTQIIALLTPAPAATVPAAGAVTDPAAPPVTTAPPPTVPPPPQNPQRAFDSAFGDYARGDFEMAIRGFEYYVEKFPTSPDASKARFHIGESYYSKGSYKEAVAAYEQVITIHKGTDWEPMALYKQGLAYEQLGQTERAKANWELVRRSFPDSSAFMLATQGLARIIK